MKKSDKRLECSHMKKAFTWKVISLGSGGVLRTCHTCYALIRDSIVQGMIEEFAHNLRSIDYVNKPSSEETK